VSEEFAEEGVRISSALCDAILGVVDGIMPLVPADDQSNVWNTALVMAVADLIVDSYEGPDRTDATKLFCKAVIKAVAVTAKHRAEQAAERKLQ